MTHPITLVLLLDAHLLARPLPAPYSRRALHLLLLTVSVSSLLDLAAAVQALVTNPALALGTQISRHTLAGCVTGAPIVTASPFPKCLVAAHGVICGLPGCSCACELGAIVDGGIVVIAPARQHEAVASALIYFAGS